MEEPELARVTVRCAFEEADAAAAALWELAGAGGRETATTAGVELEVWLSPDRAGDGAGIRRGLRDAGVAATVVVRPEPAGWLDGQRRFHRAFAAGEALWVRPPWEPRRPGYADVEIDPGMAFGTGQHATTRGCLELLAERPGPGSLLDVGCGSGVLAIAARRLGFDPVHAVDHDPAAVAATARNARANGVGLIVGRRDLDRDPLPRSDVLVANLTAALLERLAARIDVPGPGRAVLSGLRPDEVDRTVTAFGRAGLRRERVVEDDGWAAVALVA